MLFIPVIAKLSFHLPLFQSLVSHDPSEMILMCFFFFYFLLLLSMLKT